MCKNSENIAKLPTSRKSPRATHAGGSTSLARLKPGPHQQQSRSNIVECYKVERCFDTVAQNGNIVEATGNKVACCFDNVASTLLLVWTELKR